jgi:AraC-like DNA-binding protein
MGPPGHRLSAAVKLPALPRPLYLERMLVDDATFRRLCRARDLLAASYNAQVPLDRAAREACLSTFHFQRVFSRTFGETPHDFLTRLRMDQARQLLAAGDLPVTEVCLEVGYSSLGTFSSRFAAMTGQSPSAFRREARRFIAPVHGWHVLYIPTCFVNFWLTPP